MKEKESHFQRISLKYVVDFLCDLIFSGDVQHGQKEIERTTPMVNVAVKKGNLRVYL